MTDLLTETARDVVESADAGLPWVTCYQYDAAVVYCAVHDIPFLLHRAEDNPGQQMALHRSLVESARSFLA